MLAFGRDITGDFALAESREWLCTNGIGGFASGTLAGSLARRYHGLLVAALKPPLGRTLLAAKLEETLTYGGAVWELGANRWQSGAVTPEGNRFIERFSLESDVPVWTYAIADALLEKRVWMEQGANTTYVQYRLLRGFDPAALDIKALVNYCDYHATTRADGWRMQVDAVSGGLVVTAFEGARPLRLLCDSAKAEPAQEWYRGYELRHEALRGLDHSDDHLHAGTFHASVAPGDSKDWGRDTMISLPGLALAMGRPGDAKRVLATFARFIDRGMLPNRFPDGATTPEYNTVDAALWYIEAVRSYHAATGDDAFLAQMYPALADIIGWHRKGTRYGIGQDPDDGLLHAGEAGVQLTWMDAKVGDWVVTPRIGKPVEINALWHNALRAMALFARKLKRPPAEWETEAARVATGFGRFWNETGGGCFDVLDGSSGNDASVRPNQIFAVSLPSSPLSAERQRNVVEICARHLLTSFGLRSLDPRHPDYKGRYRGGPRERDAAYHQGTVWGWLLGPFALAHFKVFGDRDAALALLEPLGRHLGAYGVGTLGEVFDGDAPFAPGGCPAQAWTVAETLRAWTELTGVPPGRAR